MAHWRQTLQAAKNPRKRPLPVVEVLEPRVLYSADSIASVLPLLLPDELDPNDSLGTSLLFDTHNELNKVDLLPDPVTPTPLIKHVVFIDSAVPELHTLVKSATNDSTTVVIVDEAEDGLAVISETLKLYSSLDSVQIVSHGASGELYLGSQNVNEQVLQQEQSALSVWSNALSSNGDILLLGCEVASGDNGKNFVETLASITGADVAASDDLTGHINLNADWDLEYTSGLIEASVQLDSANLGKWFNALGNITVDTTTDKFSAVIQDTWDIGTLLSHRSATPGFEVSLREALYVSQNLPDVDTITLPGGIFTLTLSNGANDGKWGDLNISQDTFIKGEDNPNNPSIINQDIANERIITASAGTLQLDNVTISNANTSLLGGGGAIYSAGSIVLTDSILKDNHSGENGGAVSTEGDLTLHRTQVLGNSSDQSGGALYAKGTLSINDSKFSDNNSLDDGGAVYADGSTLNISGSGFTNNFTQSVAGSAIVGNGGAVAGSSTIDISASSFDGNETRNVNQLSKGGAVYHQGSGAVNLSDVTFSENSSVYGGAVYTNQTGTIANVTFAGNQAILDGAAIQSDGLGVNVGSSIFADNNFVSPAAAGSTHTVVSVQSVLGGNVASLGFNLYDFDPSAQLSLGVGDLVNTAAGSVSAQLSALSEIDSSYVKVHALNEGSQAINAGRVSVQGAEDAQGFSRDQVSDIGASEYDSAASIVVWTDEAGGIFRSDTDFSNVQQILIGVAIPGSLQIDESASKIYWLTNGSGNVNGTVDLMSASIDGLSGEVTLLSNLVGASSLAINSVAGHLYVAIAGNAPRIDRYDIENILTNPAAAPVTVVANNAGNTSFIDQNDIILNPTGMVFNNATEQLLWSNSGDVSMAASLRVFDVASNNVSMMAGTANSIAVNAEGTSTFWVDATANVINEFDSDSASLTQTQVPVLDASPTAIAYAKTEDLLVWISDATSSLSSSNAADNTVSARYEHGSLLGDVATMRTTTVTEIPVITTNVDMVAPEGSDRLLPKTNLIATDADTDAANIVYTVTSAPAHGYLTLQGNPTTTFTQNDLAEDLVNYVHDGSETQADQVELQVSDGINSSDRFKFNINITQVNDAPTLQIATDEFGVPIKLLLIESGTATLDTATLIGFDVESQPAQLVYEVTSAVTAGSLLVEGVEATQFSGAQLAAGQVVFQHNGSEVAPENLAIKLTDGDAGNGESGTVSLMFDFVGLNDAPVLTTSPTSVYENSTVQITNQNLVITDSDIGYGNVVYNLSVLPEHGSVEVEGRGQLLSTSATFTQVELNSGLVFYTPTVNNAENATYQIVFEATDPEGGKSGPVPLELVVTGVNTTPTLTTSSVTLDEGSQVVLSSANLLVNDVDSPTDDWVLSYAATSDMSGTIKISNQIVELDEDGYSYFTYQDLLLGNVVYHHDGSEADNAEIRFRVGDGISVSEEAILRLAINPVNDVPTFALNNNSISAVEGGAYIFQASDFTYADADSVVEQTRIFFSAADTARGEIQVGGVSATSFTLAELADGQVVYTHDGSEPDVAGDIDSFNFVVSDGQSESMSVQLNIFIESQNDLPLITFVPSAQTVLENTPGQVVGEITYTDADTGDTVEISVNDSRFILIPLDENSVQLVLGENAELDFEVDTIQDTGNMRLEITAFDSNPNVVRPSEYSGVSQEESLPVGDVNDAPIVDAAAVATEVPGDAYVFNNSWVVDQDDNVEDLSFVVTMVDSSALPAWLVFNPDSRSFEVTDPESAELSDIDVIVNINDAAGATTSVPISLLFSAAIDPAAAQAGVEPIEPVEIIEPEEVEAEITPLEPLSELIVDNAEPEVDLAALIPPPTAPQEQLALGRPGGADADSATRNVEADENRRSEVDEEVDLHDLIKPLASIGTLQIAVLDNTAIGGSQTTGSNRIGGHLDTRDLNDLFSQAQSELRAQTAMMAVAMDNKDIAQDERSAESRALFGTSTGLSTGLSVGYLIWLVRGGTLMGSVMSSLPAWRFVDPLPVLASLSDDMENDDESLESIVNNDGKSLDPAPSQTL